MEVASVGMDKLKVKGPGNTSGGSGEFLVGMIMAVYGAYLVLQNELTPGAMIAGSILLGRALAPIEVAIGQWALVQRASKGWNSLAELLTKVPAEQPCTALPKPRARLDVQSLTVVPPGGRVGLCWASANHDERVFEESLIAFKRAGADGVLTYAAVEVAERLAGR